MATTIPVRTKSGLPRTVQKPTDILVATAIMDLSVDTAFILDCSQLQTTVDQFPVLGMFVDNSTNPQPLQMVTEIPISQPITIPAYSQARLPFEGGQPAKMYCTTGRNVTGTKITVQFLNYVPAPIIWYPGGTQKQDISCGFHTAAIPFGEDDSLPGLTVALALGATSAFVITGGDDGWWRDDGTGPVVGGGMPIANGASVTFNSDLTLITFTGNVGPLTLYVTYYK